MRNCLRAGAFTRCGEERIWGRPDLGEAKRFVQRFEMLSPTGRVAKENETPFEFSEGKYNHKVRLKVFGLPIGESGVWIVNLYVREDLPDAQWSHAGALPLHIELKRKQSEESTAEAATTPEVG
jgi:hypothetical protein